MLTFGQAVKKRREELNLTQEQLALMLGYKDKSGINKIENCKNNIKHSKMKKLADALGVTPDYFFDEECDKMVKNNFGEKIKTRRTQLGLSMEDLAKKVGLANRSTIYKWETNQNAVTTDGIEKLASALDVTPDYFFIDEDEMKKDGQLLGFPPLEIFTTDLESANFPVEEYLSLSPEQRNQALSSFALIVKGLANNSK